MPEPIYSETVAALGDPADWLRELKSAVGPMIRLHAMITGMFEKLCEIVAFDE